MKGNFIGTSPSASYFYVSFREEIYLSSLSFQTVLIEGEINVRRESMCNKKRFPQIKLDHA